MKTTTTLLLLLITLTTYSQGDDNTVNYTYDNAGNRTASCGNAFKSFGSNEQGKPSAPPLEELFALVTNTQKDEQTPSEKSETEKNIRFNIFPNPATDKITLSREVVGQSLKQATVYLLDADGKIIDKIMSNKAIVNFNVQGLAAGVYYVYLVSDFGYAQSPNIGYAQSPDIDYAQSSDIDYAQSPDTSSAPSSTEVATDEAFRRAWRVVVKR